MTDLIKIAVDAMGGDNSPNKVLMELFLITSIKIKFFIKFLVMKIKSEILLVIKSIMIFIEIIHTDRWL